MAKMNYQRKQQSNRYISFQNNDTDVATPRQIKYMKQLGIPYYSGLDRKQCSILIASTLRAKAKPDQTSQD